MRSPRWWRKWPRSMTDARYLTERSSARTYGPKIAKVAEWLGRPLMPWQLEAANLIGEVDERGHPVHKTVVVTVPRQSGKTALMHAVMLHRLFTRTQARVWYTAETGVKAKSQLIELIDTLELPGAKLGPIVDCKRGAGDTSVKVPKLGSSITAFNPDKKGIHGKQADLVVIDEAWYFSEDQAADVMAGVTPTKNTRPNAQTIILSTMGTAASTWFHGYVDRGRAGEIALVDYGIGPEVDPNDDAAIAAAHPAIGHVSPPSIIPDARLELAQMPAEFIRAYGNRPTAATEQLIPAELAELATVTTDLPAGAPSFGAAVSFERDEAAIVSCVIDATGVPWLEVVQIMPAAELVAAKLATITDRNGGHVVIDGSGPAGSLAESAERAGAIVTRIGTTEFASATADMLDRLRRPLTDPAAPPAVRLRAHPAFAEALDAATLRTVGDRQVLARRGSAAPITVLEAAVLAVRAALTKPKPPVAPKIWI